MTRPGRGESTAGVAAGAALSVCAAFLVVAAVVDLADGARASVDLAVGAVGAAAAGWGLLRAFRLPARVRSIDAYGGVASAWLAMIATSTVVYLLSGAFTRVDDALFESVAGFSTAALSVLRPIEGTPEGVLFWRASTQWIGGIAALGVVVGVLPLLGVGGVEVSEAHRAQGAMVLRTPRVRNLLRRLLQLYCVLTVAGVVLYLAGGMRPFDAVTYAFTTISTGGFGNHDGSFRHFGSPLLEWFAVGGMVLAGANLALLWRALRGATDSLLRSTELRAYATVLVVATLTIMAWTADGGLTHRTVRHAAFSVASVVSTTGYTATDWGEWALGAQVLLLMLLGVGAMSGSTGGGFRMLRALTLLGYMRREVTRLLHPRAVISVKVSGIALQESLVARMLGYQALFLLVAATGAVTVAAFDTELATAASGAISAMATVGPALGELDPSGGADVLTAPARAVIMVLALIGRLEIYPVLLPVGAALGWGRRALAGARP